MWFSVSSWASTLRLRASRGLLRLGDVLGPDADAAALQRLGGDVEGAAPARRRWPSARPRAAGRGWRPRWPARRRRGRRPAPRARGLVQAGGVDGLQPGGVDPDRRAVGRGDPGRAWPARSGRRRSAARSAGPASSPSAAESRSQASAPAARPSTATRPPRRRALHLEGAGLAALEQGAQAPRMVGVGAHQGVDHGLRRRRRAGPGPRRRRPGTPRPRPAGRGRPPRPAGRNRRPRPRPGRPRRGPRRRPAAAASAATRACGRAPLGRAPRGRRRWPATPRPPPPQGSVGGASIPASATLRRITWSHTKPRADLAASAPRLSSARLIGA